MVDQAAKASAVAVNNAIAAAQDLPDLINKVKAADPDLATALTGKALIASKTPWGVLATTGITYLVAKYGLGWSQEIDELVAGVAVLAGSYLMRYISPGRITGFFNKATVATNQGMKS